MDQAAAIAQAIIIAGTLGVFISIAQERFLGKRLDGPMALVVNAGISLGIGVVAVVQSGGFVLTAHAGDPIGTAISILANAGIVLAASQAAFRILTNPVAQAAPTP